jgi:quercetin dioxygenase-like cupin family protein
MVTDELAARNVDIVSPGQRETVDVLGIWCEWKTTEDETNHHYSVMEMIVPPGAGVPLHRHAIQETFTVLDGAAEFGRLGENGEEWRPIARGDVVNVANWAYHGFRNSGSSPARIQLTCAAGLEAFFRECGIQVEPGSTPTGAPVSGAAIERVVTIAAKHGSFFNSGGR